MSEAGPHLVLVFTRGQALADWDRTGVIDRELAIYRRLIQRHGLRVTLITFGGPEDLALADRVAPIRVCCNHHRLPRPVYRWALPRLHRATLRDCDLVKTNQTDGAELALRIAAHRRKPLVARCGYMWSQFLGRRRGADDPRAVRARAVEARVFGQATRVQVTTDAMAHDVQQRVPAAAGRVRVVPNYVQTELFCPPPDAADPPDDLIFVGRTDSPQKNLPTLVQAIADLPVRLVLVGHHAPPPDLAAAIDAADAARITWHGGARHDQLSALLASAKVFILPSLYEGHPKALIEAMACGRPIIATDRPGMADLVQHRRTGYLCDPDPASLRAAIQRVLGDPELRRAMGQSARAFAVEHFALDRVCEQEWQVIQEAAGDG